MYILGFDIGGTKCAVITAEYIDGEITLLKKEKCPTDLEVSPEEMIGRLIRIADSILTKKPDTIGISCGGPLDSVKGVIMSPPNLPGCDNLIFLTFGTGLGAGLILDGRLYKGTNGNAGEVGHIRLNESGPVGYGKAGSFEGFCSGGGIARLGFTMALERLGKGECPSYFREGMSSSEVTAKSIAEAADKGDKTPLEVYRICGERLGRGLAILIDILNPQKIVIGNVFARAHHLLWESARKMIEKEALPLSVECCRVLPAELGESIGDYAVVAAALE